MLSGLPINPSEGLYKVLDIDGDMKDLPWITHWWYVVVGSRDWLISHHAALNHNNGPDQWQQQQ